MDKYDGYLISFQCEITLYGSSVRTLNRSTIEWHPKCFRFFACGLFLSLEMIMLHCRHTELNSLGVETKKK